MKNVFYMCIQQHTNTPNNNKTQSNLLKMINMEQCITADIRSDA